MKNILIKTQQKIYAIFQTLKTYALKLRISSFVSGNFKKNPHYWEIFRLDFMKHIQKYFWVYSILLILIGIGLESLSNDAEIVGKEVTKTLLNKKEVVETVYVYQPIKLIPKILSNILYGTAISLILLFLIDKRIDLQEAEKLRALINKNIFDGVLKKIIPEVLFDKFNKDIFDSDVVRKNAYWTYEITKNTHKSYNVKQSIRYELHNLNSFDIKQTLPLDINTTLSFVDSKLTTIEIFNSDKTKNTNFDKTLKTVDIPKNDYVEVSMVVDNEYKQNAVLDVHNSMFSIIGLTIETIQPKDVSVRVQPSFTSGLKKLETGLETISKYEKVDCILQGQGIVYVIEPLSDEKTEESDTQTKTTTKGENRMLNE